VELKPTGDIGFAKPSPISGPVTEAVQAAARSLWGGVAVSHSMGTGATDSRHLREIGIQSYGLGGAPGTLDDQRAGRAAHGADERRPIKWMGEGVHFLREVTLQLAR
jgi:acetylornithine deacetylase/succinyl-diaminopimelate desuccinylase-like protein